MGINFLGLEYTLARVPIASTDFSTHEYSYDDVADDLSLAHFQLAPEDVNHKVSQLLSCVPIPILILEAYDFVF